MKKVTVVVPIYNQEEYLERSISSILNQSYRNLQIVLVNDGSTDASESMIEKYKQQDSRIEVIHKTNGGLVDATLAGIRIASGEYICFVDADDYVGANYVHFYVDKMEETIDFVATGFYYDSGEQTALYLEQTKLYNEEEIKECRKTFITDYTKLELSRTFFVSRCNKLYRTDVVKTIANDFVQYKNVSMGEDSIFTYLLLLNCKSCKSVSEANSYFYNIANNKSMTQNGNLERFFEANRKTYELFVPLVEKHGDSSKQPLALYYMQLSTRLHVLSLADRNAFCNYYGMLKHDKLYNTAIEQFAGLVKRKKDKVQIFFFKFFKNGFWYYQLIHIYYFFKPIIAKILY